MRAIALVVALALAARVNAAIIQSVPRAGVPVNDPASVFDVSNPGITYALGSGTSFAACAFGGYDTRDLFGGQFGTFTPETGDVVFANQQPIGTVDTVLVTLPTAVSLANFNLWLNEDSDGSGHRSASEFKLYAGPVLIDDVNVLDRSGSQTYAEVYGGDVIEVSDVLANAPMAFSYTLECIQNQGANVASGVRALEFEGATAPVPEPATVGIVGLGGVVMLLRRRR
ncbi:MAG: PEP-CTERM sorting domain-containing protein [Tepidisphaeraceae bacterium]|jgi:hypothetical protein